MENFEVSVSNCQIRITVLNYTVLLIQRQRARSKHYQIKTSLISGASQHPTSDFLTASKFRSQTLNRLLAPMSPISEGGRHIKIYHKRIRVKILYLLIRLHWKLLNNQNYLNEINIRNRNCTWHLWSVFGVPYFRE